MKKVRTPAVAGMFYPADADELNQQLDLMFRIAQPEKEYRKVRGIIAPHAGYVYSGKTAAYAYNAIKNSSYNSVVVISPSHREYFYGSSVYDGDAYSTPLGEIEIDKSMCEKIITGGKFISFGVQGHRGEHALEVQLPFLQKVLTEFKLVPIVMGDQSEEIINDLANALAKSIDEKTLIVASSDLSHFHSKEIALQLDSRVLERVSNFNYEALVTDLNIGRSEACGGGPIAAMMKALDLLGIRKVDILARSDSGDVTGDNSEVVGYMSAVIYE